MHVDHFHLAVLNATHTYQVAVHCALGGADFFFWALRHFKASHTIITPLPLLVPIWRKGKKLSTKSYTVAHKKAQRSTLSCMARRMIKEAQWRVN